MNDDDLDRRDDRARAPADGERPAVVAYDPYFPAARPPADDARPTAYDPYFPQDGASEFD
ncbi:hypothetical protein [Salinarimonas ramus]|uniref:Uncharacterized protein n=1 Tax=Salinarimonas ramus TaxID=690164 RepID=A0A917V1D3_9HYPH|nr:hypothetical protein [Salinarimonas ramus]GGK18497.1 hypothetical protein GCM10011322_01520 [Salinarimonas ramus]